MKFDANKLQGQFQQWEIDRAKFERAIGEEVSDAAKVGLLITLTTGKLHYHLCLSADAVTN
eukprot:2018968-Lingulodinium_polyedra.AAC.1